MNILTSINNLKHILTLLWYFLFTRGRRDRDRMVVGFATTYAICAYHRWLCEFESRSWRGVQHYVIKCVSDLCQAGGFLRVFRFPPPIRKAWRYQRGNQNPYIEEEQTTQWPIEKVQKDKQRSTKHTYKTKDRVTRTPLKTGGELGCSGRVSSSCSTSSPRRVNLVTNPVISREWGKDREVFPTSGTYQWSYDFNFTKGTLGSVASLLAATL
jgi:hypothetical protein